MYIFLKSLVLQLFKYSGAFALLRFKNRHALRILCYHGFSLHDEHEFMPGLFMAPAKFRARMEFLKKAGFQFLSLAVALKLWRQDKLPKNSLVLTVDDGFKSTYTHAYPILQELKIPMTLYLTSYYSAKENPIFRLWLRYIFWKTKITVFDASELAVSLKSTDKEAILWELIAYGENQLAEKARWQLAQDLTKILAVTIPTHLKDQIFSLMNGQEIINAHRDGMDIQLHTHRHRFPHDLPLAEKEIIENREYLSSLVDKPYHHFCYPSGEYHKKQFPLLEKCNIASATTCDFGINHRTDHPFALKRVLDGHSLSNIQIEAELLGMGELFRTLKNWPKFLRTLPRRLTKLTSAAKTSGPRKPQEYR